jgi:geranylgeranyl transferase type-2 subunit beta
MPAEPYLPRLTARLAAGLGRIDPERRHKHTDYLRESQNADGGWSGREGGSDLYYTSFALRGLAVLGALDDTALSRAAGFLRASLSREASPVDFFSLLYSCLILQAAGGEDVLAGAPEGWVDRVGGLLASFRSPDGGYAKMPGGPSGSTYTTFLVSLCHEVLGRGVPEPERVSAFVLSRRREDGGFVEMNAMRRSGTNPTAAAVGVLQLAGGMTPEVRDGVVEFLAAMSSLEGGLRANDRVPLADTLSTFTGSWTLSELGALDRLDAEKVLDYASDVEHPPGGFFGGLWDEGYDVEYTFYGLGVLGLFGGG